MENAKKTLTDIPDTTTTTVSLQNSEVSINGEINSKFTVMESEKEITTLDDLIREMKYIKLLVSSVSDQVAQLGRYFESIKVNKLNSDDFVNSPEKFNINSNSTYQQTAGTYDKPLSRPGDYYSEALNNEDEKSKKHDRFKIISFFKKQTHSDKRNNSKIKGSQFFVPGEEMSGKDPIKKNKHLNHFVCSQTDQYLDTTGIVKQPPLKKETDGDAEKYNKEIACFNQQDLSISFINSAANVNITQPYEHTKSQQHEDLEHENIPEKLNICKASGFIKQEWMPLENPKRQTLKLILFGCSGYGKSSTINSLIGFPCMNTSSKMLMSEQNPVLISSIVNGVGIDLVGTPGIEETKKMSHIEVVMKSLNLAEHTFSGLLLVLKYGERFTQQPKSVVKSLKGILGEKVIEDNCICVMTHGEQFDDYMRQADEPLSFDQWCRQQDYDIGMLFRECQYRCVLFENKTIDWFKLKSQFDSLMSMVNQLKMYKKCDFESISKRREMFLLKCSLPQITEKANKEIDTHRAELRAIETHEYNTEEKVSNLTLLLGRIEELKCSVPVQAKRIQSEIMILKSEVVSKLNLLQVKEII